ncbi:MAG: restriction endonuclease subunit S [Marmoricola sp.]
MSTLTEPSWPNVRLGDVGQSLIGLTYSPSSVKRSGTLVLRSSNIQDGSLAFDDNVYVDCAVPEKIRVRENDILICVRNGSRRLIGKSVILDRRVVGQTFGAFMAVYRSPSNPFLQYFFQSEDFKRQIDQHLGATINQITNGSLNSFVVALPTAPEQQAITASLQDADRLIATLERLIAKKQAIKQGMMQQLLTGRTRLPGFEGEWTVTPVGSLARVTGGGTPSTGVSSYWGGGIPWFTPAEISSGGAGLVATSERTITQDGLANSAATLLPEGSVLVTSRASIGNCAVAAVPVATNQGFTSMIPRDRRSTWFLYYWVQQYRAEFESRSAGSTFLEISASKVAAIPLAAPGLPEQQAIGEVLRDADTELDALKSRLAKARAIKAGMMQQLLTGRTRLPVEAAS